ncbi:redoxin family protein [Mucilaginibacter lacusdianchii]|uniref:redoxin family protein n=1 Tax=Mucilaginibacter lacusdianchii TaxID=2684211 RepID=UPI00131AD786|nr:redoxin family protein [Mucilaginibacter sp. JXJ CY 39]
MKKLILIIISIIATVNCFAQFRISGQVLNKVSAGTDSLTINLPFVYGYNPEGDIRVIINRQGKFSANLPVSEKKLATLTYKKRQYLLLLSPEKSLTLELNAADTTIRKFSGPEAIENKLLYSLNLLQPPFFRAEGSSNLFSNLSPEAIQEKVVKPWLEVRDRQLTMIKNAQGVSKFNKLLISQEVKANTIMQLSRFARINVRMKRDDLVTFIMSIYKNVAVRPEVQPAGPLFYEFADSYVGYMEAAAFSDFQKRGSNTKTPLVYFGISLDSINQIAREKGKMYVNWLAIKNNFDPNVAEAMLAQAIAAKSRDKELTELRPLMDEFKSVYAHSGYTAGLTDKLHKLETALTANKNNKAIQIFNDYQQLTSIYQVINQYKGKVVYLDIWGTWCAPCRYELGFTPQLKQHFKDKDVVFIYLDMDDNGKDAHWREFLQVNNLSGLHLRKSNQDIQKIWEEVQPLKDKQGMYPSYFIFDKNGKLVPETAKRPSEGVELFKQLEQYL